MTLVVSLLILGVILLLIEILAVPGLGIPGFLGFFLLVIASYLGFQKSMEMGLASLGVGVVITVSLSYLAFRSKTWERFAVKSAIDSKSYSVKEDSLAVGDLGVTITRINSMGKARFENQELEVKSFSTFISEGIEVEITEISGNSITIKPKT